MNYKKIVRSKGLRQKIMKLLSFVPDKMMLRFQYKLKLGRSLDLTAPRRYTEKLQLYKLYYRNPALGQCVDKLRVREYVARKGIDVSFPALYGVYNKGEEIDFEKLPDRFVIKTTDGGGGDNIVICRDKQKLDIPATVKKLNSWLNKKNVNAGREWAYTLIPKSVIIVEEFLENPVNPDSGLEDYKILCFDGQPYCIVHDTDRYTGHKRNFYNLNWENLHISSDCPNPSSESPKPDNLEKMLEIASQLSWEFPFVRVDLYSIKGKIYFGELTFYPWSGYVQFKPDSFDFELGNRFNISNFYSIKEKS